MQMLKRHIKQYLNRRRFPHAQVDVEAQVVRSTFGAGTVLEPQVYLQDVTAGDALTVRCQTTIHRMLCEDHILIGGGSFLADVRIGRMSYLSLGTMVSLTSIGRFCSIGAQLLCGSGHHPLTFVSTSPVFYSAYRQCGMSYAAESLVTERQPITIGHDVWIGARVFIRDGVTVGNGAVIGAGAVVVKDVPSYAVVAGVPAHVLRYRFDEETIAMLQQSAWWEWDDAVLQCAQPLMAVDDPTAFLTFSAEQASRIETR